MDPKKQKLLDELKKRKKPQSLNERYSSMLQHHRERSSSKLPPSRKERDEEINSTEDPIPSTSKAALASDMENLNMGEKDTSANASKTTRKIASRKEKIYPHHHNLHTISGDEVAPDIFPMEPAEENIYDTRDFELSVQEKKMKNESIYDVSNHLCSIKVTKKNKKRILLSNISEVLLEELTKIIERIQNEYKDKDYRRQIYVTIVDSPNIATGINTRNYSLQESAAKIAGASLKHLESFLTSHKNMSLDNAFHIDIKTLGLPNVQHRVLKKGNLKVHVPESHRFQSDSELEDSDDESDSNAGTNVQTGYTPNPKSRERWKFFIPKGYYENKNIFANYCLIIATIIGVYHQISLPLIEPYKKSDYDSYESYGKIWTIICEIHSKNLIKQKFAGRKLNELLCKTLKENNLDPIGPYNVPRIIPILATYFNCNIIVYSERVDKNGITFQFPEKIITEHPTIRLFQEMVHSSEIDHMSVIINPFRFKAKFHLECPICNKTFSSHRKAHKCLQTLENCYTCNRHYRTKDMYINTLNCDDFCDSRLQVAIVTRCKTCEKLLYSTSCQKRHDSYCCINGFMCKLCNKFVRQDASNSLEETKKLHICDQEKTCYICYERYSCVPNNRDHLCKMAIIKPQLFHANIGFINMITYEQLVGQNETDVLPVFFDVAYEIRRFTFAYFQVSDKQFGFDDKNYENDRFLTYKYLKDIKLLDDYYTSLAHSTGRRNNKSAKKTTDQDRIQLKLQFIVNFSVCEKLIQALLKPSFHSYTFIVQDQELLYYIYSTLIRLMIYPHSCNSDGSDMIYLTVTEYNITFVCYKSYLDFDLGTLKDMFNLSDTDYPYPLFPSQKHIFGEKFPDINTRLMYFPELTDFLDFTDTAKIVAYKQKAYALHSRYKMSYHVTQNMLVYAKNKMKISVTAMLSFLQQLFLIQTQLHKQFPGKYYPVQKNQSKKQQLLPLFSPFTTPIFTLASFNYTLFRYFGLNCQLYAIRNEFGSWVYNCSPKELEFILWHTNRLRLLNKPVYSPFSPEGIKRLCNLIPDVATDNWAAWFHGCAIHAHYPCKNNPQGTAQNTQNPWGKTYLELKEKWEEDMAIIKKRFPNFSFDIVWECEWSDLKRNTPGISLFLNNPDNLRPKKRMVPREALKNPITQVYAHYYDPTDNINDKMIVEDAVSCYPTEMLKQLFPTGEYITIIGPDLKFFEIKNGQCFFQSKLCWGIAQVQFVMTNIMCPFMPVTVRESTVLANCYKCVSSKSVSPCLHSDIERSFTETMTLADLLYLVETGCEILKIFEANIYFNADFIFHEYIKYTSSNKLRYSDPPKNVKIEDYCQKANKEMNFTGTNLLKPSDITPNPNLRFVYKTMENSLFGKFAQGGSKIRSKLLFSQSDLVKCFEKSKLTNFKCISQNVVQVWIKEKPKKIQRGSCSIISAYILSYARIQMHRRICQVSEIGKIFHCSVDQLIYTIPKERAHLFENFEIYGFMRNVYEGWIVEGYCAVSPHFYVILLSSISSPREFKTVLKCRGIVTNTIESASFFSYDNLRQIVLQQFRLFYGISDTISIPQTKRRKKSLEQCAGKLYSPVNLKTHVKNSRLIDLSSEIYCTFPLGYKK